MKPWKTLDQQIILNHNQFLRVENHVALLPDGQIIDDWPWVVTPDYMNVVVEREEFRVLGWQRPLRWRCVTWNSPTE